ncbi:hypothetical protein ACS0TY_002867 [Phlomoides rotata]
MVPIKATAQMGLRIHTLPPNLLPKFQFHPFPAPLKIANPPRTLAISCSKEKENFSDEILAVELSLQMKKLKSDAVQREEALKKSRELLFTEVSNFTGLKSEDLKKKWRRMNEEERLVLVRGFVAEWSAHFHPLSARSVKEMVEQYVQGQSHEFSDSLSGKFFSDFTKLLGFSEE